MRKLLFVLALFTLSLLAKPSYYVNTIPVTSKYFTYIAKKGESVQIDAENLVCTGLTKEKSGSYVLKVVTNTSVICGDNTLKIVIADAPLKGHKVAHYKIGTYPSPLRGLKSYTKPTKFLTIDSSTSRTKLSDHFNLESFKCKQRSKYPKYLLSSSKLIAMLELIVQELQDRGIKVNKITIMSGYRTPAYNSAIGSSKFSRHMYGDAADIYIDQDNDGRLDDLNQDGKIDDRDTAYLATLIDGLQKKYPSLVGGIGKYKRNSRHPRFVHVDTRGQKARW